MNGYSPLYIRSMTNTKKIRYDLLTGITYPDLEAQVNSLGVSVTQISPGTSFTNQQEQIDALGVSESNTDTRLTNLGTTIGTTTTNYQSSFTTANLNVGSKAFMGSNGSFTSSNATLTTNSGVNGWWNTSNTNALRVCGNDNGCIDFGVDSASGCWIQSRDVATPTINYPLVLQGQGGKTGVGITNPAYTLDVSGDINSSGSIRINGNSLGTSISNTDQRLTDMGVSIGSSYTLIGTSISNDDTKISNIGTSISNMTTDMNVSSSYKVNGTLVLGATILGSGVVNSSLTSFGNSPTLNTPAIGTSMALSPITINPYSVGLCFNNNSSTQSRLWFSGNNTTNNQSVLPGIGVNTNDLILTNGIGNMYLFNGLGGAQNLTMSIIGTTSSAGKVGINATPIYQLDVGGDTNISSGSQYRINGSSVLSADSLGSGVVNSSLTSFGNNPTINTPTIGTSMTTPSIKTGNFTISPNVGNDNNGTILSIKHDTGSNQNQTYLQFLNSTNYTTSGVVNAIGSADNDLYIINNTGNLRIPVGLGYSNHEMITILGSTSAVGTVGINNSSPSYLLDIGGDTNISSGSVYRINGSNVLSVNTLGSGVVNSSLTSFGSNATMNSPTLTYPVLSFGNSIYLASDNGTGVDNVASQVNVFNSVGNQVSLSFRKSDGTGYEQSIMRYSNNSMYFRNDYGDLTFTVGNGSSYGQPLYLKYNTALNSFIGVNNNSPSYDLDIVGNCNVSTGYNYMLNGNSVLTGSTLGSVITNSSLTKFGSSPTLNTPIVNSATLNTPSATGAVSSYGLGGVLSDTTKIATRSVYNSDDTHSSYPSIQELAIKDNSFTFYDGYWTGTNFAYGISSGSNTVILNKTNGRYDIYNYVSTGFGATYVLGDTAPVLSVQSGKIGVNTSVPSDHFDVNGNCNIANGYSYKINGTSVLNQTTLGSGVVNSSLTSFGTNALFRNSVNGSIAIAGGGSSTNLFQVPSGYLHALVAIESNTSSGLFYVVSSSSQRGVGTVSTLTADGTTTFTVSIAGTPTYITAGNSTAGNVTVSYSITLF